MNFNFPETSLLPPPPAAMQVDHENQLHRLKQQQQQMTIFYNGTICVCDVTEIQARTIMWLASREVEERTAISPSHQRPPYSPVPAATPPPAMAVAPAPGGPPPMKRSLQRFLEKRNQRIHAAAP